MLYTDMVNRLVDTAGEGEDGANWENSMKTYTLSYVKETASGNWLYDQVSVLVVQPCFSIPWTAAHQVSLYVDFSRQEYWSGLPSPSPAYPPDPGVEPRSPASQVDSEPLGKPTVWGRKLEPGALGQPSGAGGGGRWEGGDTCTPMADPCWCTAETNSIF